MKLGGLLSKQLRAIEGVRSAPVTEGSEHAYWSYPIGIEQWTAQAFADALTAEGVPAGAGYIGNPIFVCAECCAGKTTYGDSHFPFDGPFSDRTIEYDTALCPKAQRALDHMVTVPIHENFSEEDVGDMASAVAKVARLLAGESS